MIDEPIQGLSQVADGYDAILCDVWGVLHNGTDGFMEAADALTRFRKTGKPVLLLTNAPRPSAPVVVQLASLGIGDGAFDGVVSSGDVVRDHMLANGFRKVLNIGPERDVPLFSGTDIALAEGVEGVDAVVLTDQRSDDHTPDAYREELAALVGAGVPVICANPDVVVDRGGHIQYCGGALAAIFEEAGGTAMQFGKPHAPIYQLAQSRLAGLGVPESGRILMVGDGLPTDITGANRQGLDVLFITDGIHAHDLGTPGAPEPAKVRDRLAQEGLSATHFMPRLVW